MKIAVVSVGFGKKSLTRQPWYYMEVLGRALSAVGHSVTYITDDPDPGKIEGTQIVSVPEFRRFPNGVAANLGERLRTRGIELIFWSTGATDFFFARGIESLKIPFVPVFTSSLYSLSELFTYRSAVKENAGVIKQLLIGPFVSQSKVKSFVRHNLCRGAIFETSETKARYGLENLVRPVSMVVPPPLEPAYTTLLSELLPKRETTDTLLYFGPPLVLRGLDLVIEAFAELKPQHPELKLKILSRTEHEHLLKKEQKLRKLVKKLKIADEVEFVSGALERRQLVKEVVNARVIALPFRIVVSDAPLVVPETLAAGTPLVTTAASGVQDYQQVDPRLVLTEVNKKSVTEAISHALSQKPVNKLDSFVENNSLGAFCDNLAHFCQEIGIV